ncbi:flagellar basal body-associated FliL family protein [Sulfurimonas sp. HSL-1716]|uniref:flagellar basal body-associated FliL family protein n=1 Tax=Hydrocurvibacter sulfurireducens TaxID=3131937 RepID=UPI0031F926B9
MLIYCHVKFTNYVITTKINWINMDIKKIFTSLIFVLSVIFIILMVIKVALKSDFANVSNRNGQGSDAGYKMKTKFYKEFYYSTNFKRNPSNDNMLSLGNFTVNINSNREQNKLIMKVSIETKEGVIDDIMDRQSVIRNDVIDSVMNLRSSTINQENVSTAIKENLNKRLKGDVIKNVYFERFIIQ